MTTVRLDELWPPGGPCAFCGGSDRRHRTFDAIASRRAAGETVESLARDFGVTHEHIRAALAWSSAPEAEP